jgi:DNA helicase-2/ATP-dependent DNA helicase PcrA
MASPAPAPANPFKGNAKRVYGPPGTGKTTFLSKTVGELIREFGPESVMLASFSTTAAKEIASRFSGDGPKPSARAIGTLHSHAFRSIGNGNVALDPKVISSWNEEHPGELTITADTRKTGHAGETGGPVADPSMAVTGDQLLGWLDRLRAAMVPREDWPVNIRRFHQEWSGWKREADCCDFTDMIEIAYERALDGELPPGRPKFLIADEAQDMTPLEVALTCAWGENVEQLIVGMDDDQAINRWRGGDPAPLLGLTGVDGGEVTDHVLEQSYRVPGSVHSIAEHWVRKLSMRREKVYRPRVDDGVAVQGAAYCVPETIQDGALIRRVTEDMATGRSVMVITSCNYMLESFIKGLRSEGIPFHNPYRPAEMRWNPLGRSSVGMSTAERVFRYMVMDASLEDGVGRFWTGADVNAWLDMVKLSSAGMVRGAKKMAELFDADAEVPFESIAAMFADESMLQRATTPDIGWLAQSLLAGKRDPASYPITIARMHGPAALTEKPNLVVGTIHSVKGAAADIVYVDPGISRAAMSNAATAAGRDEVIRLFYVAMTRAYSELRLLHPVTDLHVNRRDLIPAHLEVMPA